MTDKLIRVTTAFAVAAVAAVAAVISYRHAYELVRSHGEPGLTARLVPFTVDGLIWAASMLILDANRHNRPVPALARWCLGAGIVATIGANLAHGLGHGPIGALVSAWPALALAGSFEFADDTDQNGDPSRCHTRPLGAGEPPGTGSEPRRTTSAHPGTKPATDRTGLAQRWPQPARHSPRTQH